MGKYEVIDRGIGQYQSREKPCPWPLLADGVSESPEREHRGRQKSRRTKVDRSNAVSSSWNAIPIVEEALQADHGEARGVGADPVVRHLLAGFRVGDFAHAL